MKKQSKMEALRKELVDLNKFIDVNLENWDPNTKAGMLGKKRSSETKIMQVKNDLAAEVLGASVGFMIYDTNTNAKAIFEALKVDPSYVFVDYFGLEKRLFNAAFDNIKGFPFNAFTIDALNRELADVVRNNPDVIHLPSIRPDAKFFAECHSREESIKRINMILSVTYKNMLKGVFLKKEIHKIIYDNTDHNGLKFVFLNVPENVDTQFLGNVSGVEMKLALAEDVPTATFENKEEDFSEDVEQTAGVSLGAVIKTTQKRSRKKKIASVPTLNTLSLK
jgi:hypothetical protein